ncbi:MAG: DUF1800 domain-containing protein [Gammaproteobacteria bacterium]|nr:DUF1800 domain-containing protein [Gammaproteobacteria bacterium]MBU1483113.1 DUF1800 domain-containing protein [Gammaproteobacteria bacterium]
MRTPYNRTAQLIGKIALLAALLTACGGGETTTTTSDAVPITAVEASRLLSQATFGPTVAEIGRLSGMGTDAWFSEQFRKPQTLHFVYMNAAQSRLAADERLSEDQFFESFWQQAINGDDQLRQRVTFALSQIFVISYQNSTLAYNARGVANYYDTLGAYAFRNFRELLEAVTLHPMMGVYLDALGNQKTSATRVPNENYAREIMQLFSIGLRQLNQDGTDTTIPPTATYINDDIKGLAKVFTGWSWAGPDKSSSRFNGWGDEDPNCDWLPMQNYPAYHETLEKVFLGVTIPANTSGEASLKIALDTLFNHPNVGPFIGRELIQRLVTSNPSPAYVGRVAAAFANNGQGVRGDMKAVIKAVLLDPEAITPPLSTDYNAGKLREPVLRLANWMRAFHATSASGRFQMGDLDDPLYRLAQTPMRSPSVFNFFRPEYVPPNTSIAAAGKFSPEMQITDETSVVGYLNYMRNAIPNGVGLSREIKADYTAELALAATPDILVDRVNLLLMQNQMSATLRAQILAAINSNPNNSNLNRVYLAIFLTMASPEYLVQK